jgi:hypothetical protein
MGVLLSRMGGDLGAQLPTVLALLMDRLRNEITRVRTKSHCSMCMYTKPNLRCDYTYIYIYV